MNEVTKAEKAALYEEIAKMGKSDPVKRIQSYLERRKLSRGLDHELIHCFDNEFELRSSDLQAALDSMAAAQPAQQMGSMPAFERQERERHRDVLQSLIEQVTEGWGVNLAPQTASFAAIRCALRVLGESLDGDAK